MLAACANSAWVIIYAHWRSDPTLSPSGEVDWYAEGALVTEAAFLLVTNAFISPIFFLIDLWHVFISMPSRLFVDCWTSRKTQSQFNEMYLGPSFSLANRIGDVIKTLFISFLFAPIIPLTPLLGFISLGFQYLFDRIFLLRLARHPHWYDKRIMTSVVRYPAYMLAPVPLGVLLLFRTPKELKISYFAACFTDSFSVWEGLDHVLVSAGAIIVLLLIFLVAAQALFSTIRCILTCQCCAHRREVPLLGVPAESAAGADFVDVQHTFLAHYHKENPVYCILRDAENAVVFSEDTKHHTVGTRGGLKMGSFLQDDGRLNELLDVLADGVCRQSMLRSQGVQSIAPGQRPPISSAPSAEGDGLASISFPRLSTP